MMFDLQKVSSLQNGRNEALISGSRYLGRRISSDVLPLGVDVEKMESLPEGHVQALTGLQIEAAQTAIRSLASLAKIGELDHLGGGLDLIPALLLTLAVTDDGRRAFTIEHAHTSVGYYATLAAYGYLAPDAVVQEFRRGLSLPGHVSWVPGGTQLNGGRLGVMVPAAVGQALGKKALFGRGSWVVVHCGDAGWISGQALNGFNGASCHRAPITFVMHRNGIQLSGSTKSVMDRDPRLIVEALGVEIVEIPSLHDTQALYGAYRHTYALAQEGRPSLIYPAGYRSEKGQPVDLRAFGEKYGIPEAIASFAAKHDVPLDREVWIPGSLMSFRDVEPMLECLFLVNGLPGGVGHHDGHMKGRKEEEVLSNPMFRMTGDQARALEDLRARPPRKVVTEARPAPGSPNLLIPAEVIRKVKLPGAGEKASPRDGTQAGYALVAERYPERVFVVGCDLDASTRLAKARSLLSPDHQFEMSIEEQAGALMANGLAMASRDPQLNVVSTFAAFFEGIAREGMDMWQYQRNLTGVNEGLNVTFHLSHVGACTGRDHFSGWGLDWVNVALTYLPYLRRFYAPADVRIAFLSIVDLAAHYGGHLVGVPRDTLPVLLKQDASGPLWDVDGAWEPVTSYRIYPGSRRAILALGAPAFLGAEASETLGGRGLSTDVHIVNGLPLPEGALARLISSYPEGVVTIEDGKIGTPETGLRGFAGLVAGVAGGLGIPHAHLGITDPRIAPSEGHMETWAHFGITAGALVDAVAGF